MASHAGHLIENPHEIGSTGLPHRKILMWLFLASDCMFFGALISTYLIYRGRSVSGNGLISHTTLMRFLVRVGPRLHRILWHMIRTVVVHNAGG